MAEGLIRTTKPFDFVISYFYGWQAVLLPTKSGVISVEYPE